MITYLSYNFKYFSLALGLALLSASSLQAHRDPASLDLEGTNLIGPKNLKPMKQPKYDWMKKDPKDSSLPSSMAPLSPKITNPLSSPKNS